MAIDSPKTCAAIEPRQLEKEERRIGDAMVNLRGGTRKEYKGG